MALVPTTNLRVFLALYRLMMKPRARESLLATFGIFQVIHQQEMMPISIIAMIYVIHFKRGRPTGHLIVLHMDVRQRILIFILHSYYILC